MSDADSGSTESPARALEPRAVADVLAEAAEWRLLGLLLERPRREWREEIAALGREVRDEKVRLAADQALEAGEGEYLALLGPGGVVSPREVTYRSFEDPGWILSALTTVYGAFAFAPRVEDPPDHVAVEVGFVGYLLLKEAFARAAGDDDAAAVTAGARAEFVSGHLSPMVGALAERLASAGDSRVALAVRLVADRVPPAPAVRSLAPEDVSDPCGMCPAGGE